MAIVAPTADKAEFRERIFSAVQQMYSDVASLPTKEFHFPTGRWACEFVGYPVNELDAIPETAVESFAGVGYPFKVNVIQPGHRVLDIGSGSGTDAFIAALKTGPEGEVCGMDITESMLDKAEQNIVKSDFNNIHIVEGNAESIPMENKSFDVVTSNGVLNLVPEKKAAFAEIYRVLKNGSRIQISDIALKSEISEKCRMNPELWADCIVGAVPEDQYIALLHEAGFHDVKIINRLDYFEGSPDESTKRTAKQYGAISVTITARKE
jgi:arsenite methyltransferase